MKPISEQNNFIYLLAALVFFLLLGAIVEQLHLRFGQRLVQSSTVVMIAIGVWSFRATKRRYWTGLGLLAAIIVVVIIGMVLESAGLNYIHLLLVLAFFIWATWLAARQVLFTGTIDIHKIVGAVCIYLLLGLIWALMYLLIAEAAPDAFNGLQQAPWYDNFSQLSYYSFVTLTTLGYGDISPVSPIAQFLAYMEAIVGIFYTTILVASLIGARMSDRKVQDR
ncbi:MAG TPA: two pore domain potassium channel family protein [Gammaproteobacteria bacterium]|nr:two pore domain potassium channel family protein [Gammaproteobacteria bacterium]